MKKFKRTLLAISICTLSGVASAAQISGDIKLGGDLGFDMGSNLNGFTYEPFSVVTPNSIDYISEDTNMSGQYLSMGGSGYDMGNGFDHSSSGWTYSTCGEYDKYHKYHKPCNVPEPGVALLLGIGLIGFGVTRKLRKMA